MMVDFLSDFDEEEGFIVGLVFCVFFDVVFFVFFVIVSKVGVDFFL